MDKVLYLYVVTVEDLQCPYSDSDNTGYYGLATEVGAGSYVEALEKGLPIVIQMLNDGNPDYTEDEIYRETDSSLRVTIEIKKK